MRKVSYYLHMIPIIILTGITLRSLDLSLVPVYLLFSLAFAANVLFGLHTLIRFQKCLFAYLMSILFLLGFWLKYSIHTIFAYPYVEPIGRYVSNPTSDGEVLLVATYGAFGFLTAQLLLFLFLRTKKETTLPSVTLKDNPSWKTFGAFTLIAALLAGINLKFNIMLFGLLPSIVLPFKGNVFFFLFLTRGLFFLLFFYALRKFSYPAVIWGSLFAFFASIGVLSRMIVLAYFIAVLIFIFMNTDFKEIALLAKRLIFFFILFAFTSYITVLVSTNLRSYQATVVKERALASEGSLQQFVSSKVSSETLRQNTSQYIQLAVDRWIGIEGLMATHWYPKKGFPFFMEALKEKSYHGKSFYTQLTNPDEYASLNPKTSVSTSVPGPIAFFYYTGSNLWVFILTCFTILSFSLLELFVTRKILSTSLFGIFTSIFMTFDFFQFGIAPIAFLKYWTASFTGIFLLFFLDKHFFTKQRLKKP